MCSKHILPFVITSGLRVAFCMAALASPLTIICTPHALRQTHAKAALDAVADLAARATLCELLVALHQLQSGLPIEPAHQRVDITVPGGHAHPIAISTVFPVFLWRGHTLAHGPTLVAQAHALARVQRQGILQKRQVGRQQPARVEELVQGPQGPHVSSPRQFHGGPRRAVGPLRDALHAHVRQPQRLVCHGGRLPGSASVHVMGSGASLTARLASRRCCRAGSPHQAIGRAWLWRAPAGSAWYCRCPPPRHARALVQSPHRGA